MFCVVGLGNPGGEYTGTRHNIGYRVVDKIASDLNTRIRRRAHSALTATVRIGRTEVLLMKPQTFMNLSGRSVSSACRAHGIAGHSLVVVHDDTDLALGRIKVRLGGGSAGHRGVGSIAEETGDPGFVRIKLGVGRPTEGDDLSDFVLSPFDQGESEVVADMVERGAEAVSSVVAEGVEVAMRRFNGVVTNVNEK